MSDITVASTAFQNHAGLYLEKSAKEPVFITRHKRRLRVLLDIDEYERLKARDTRRTLYTDELPDDVIKALKTADVSHIDPALDALMD
jgi:prevent-host-death family protein